MTEQARQGGRPEWDSATYHRVSAPHVEWGRKVLARLVLRGDETVLDAGCGTGRLTAELLDRLPRGRVVALDVSENMLGTAREYLEPRYGERVEFVRADLLALPFSNVEGGLEEWFEGRFDGVFSTATFHWVLDHDALYRGLHRALRPDGWLCAQCGGGPNLARFMTLVAEVAARPPFSLRLEEYEKPVYYEGAEEAAERLRRAGYVDVQTSVEFSPAAFADAAAFVEFVRTVILRHHLERLPDAETREQFLHQLARASAQGERPYELDYWRLNVWGRRGA